MSTSIDALAGSFGSSSGSAATKTGTAESFLKLLVTQLENQDPLNPMDNAQVTSQMAQINTVTGIENLNTSVQALHAQFVQMQALQGATLVGRDVTVQGNQLSLAEDGVTAQAGFSLAGPADTVQIEILDGAGKVVDTLQLGAQSSGRQAFEWDASAHPEAEGYTFRITAKLGASDVAAEPLMLDRVSSVGLDGQAGLMLHLERAGDVPYGEIFALN